MKSRIDLSHLAEKWPSSIVARKKVREFTGGMISPGTLANLDSQGIGPPCQVRIGKNVGYVVLPFVKWLEERA
jgi:hypothetical protein